MSQYPDFYDLIWPNRAPIVDSWLNQEIQFSTEQGEAVGIVQPKNGPCGVLAAVQAALIAYRMDREGECSPGKAFTPEEITGTLSEMISRCSADDLCRVVLWEKQPGGNVVIEEMPSTGVSAYISNNLEAFLGVGGPILLVYSVVATRTKAQVEEDIVSSGGDAPLIYGINFLCTSELVMLLIRGVASGNVSAYAFGDKLDYKVGAKVGLLTRAEVDTGVPVADVLKKPELPVWILHGGDHFTVMYNTKGASGTADDLPPLSLVHWNGLPPAGPRLATFTLTGSDVAESAPETMEQTYFKPVPGEIEDIVQAYNKDKERYKNRWDLWRYEAVLAVEDPTIKGAERPPNNPPTVFEQGEVVRLRGQKDAAAFFNGAFQKEVSSGAKPTQAAASALQKLQDSVHLYSGWRCATCYRTRFQTMRFGQNEGCEDVCAHCGTNRNQGGWSIWVPYKDLPIEWKKKMDNRYAPKVISLLRTKWPGCDLEEVSSMDARGYPSV